MGGSDKDNAPANPAGGAQDVDSLIEFPAELAVKAMGLNRPGFRELVTQLVEFHLPDGTDVDVTTLESSQGKYVSVRVRFVAESREQLESIYGALRAEQRVLFTL